MSGLFDKLPRSRPPRRLMHVFDVADESGRLCEFRCKRGHTLKREVTPPDCTPRDGELTLTQAKRGIPCPTCADQARVT
jgi:hypothetical protein